MKAKVNRLAPPGFDVMTEIRLYAAGIFVFMLPTLIVPSQFFSCRAEALERIERYAIEGYVYSGESMPDFADFALGPFFGICIPLIIMLGYIIMHYRYHYKGAMSIYLMRRLPSRMELHRRCLTLPLAAMVLTLLTAAVLLAVYFAVYMLATPPELLSPNQFEKLWRGIL